MPARSLREIAISAAVRNLPALLSVGDMEYTLVRPILQRLDVPLQLHHIEENSPQICGHSEELWRAFIVRDYPHWKHEADLEAHRGRLKRLYLKLAKREKERRAKEEKLLIAAMNAAETEKIGKNQMQYVQKVIPQATKQRDFVDGVYNPNAGRWGNSVKSAPSLRQASKTGRDIISAIRKQVATGNQQKSFVKPQPHIVRSYIPDARTQAIQATRQAGSVSRPNQNLRRSEVAQPSPAAKTTAKLQKLSFEEKALEEALLEKQNRQRGVETEQRKRVGVLRTTSNASKRIPGSPARVRPQSMVAPPRRRSSTPSETAFNIVAPPPADAQSPKLKTPKITARSAEGGISRVPLAASPHLAGTKRPPSPTPVANVRKRHQPSIFMPKRRKE